MSEAIVDLHESMPGACPGARHRWHVDHRGACRTWSGEIGMLGRDLPHRVGRTPFLAGSVVFGQVGRDGKRVNRHGDHWRICGQDMQHHVPLCGAGVSR
jgi:hypothetical protein